MITVAVQYQLSYSQSPNWRPSSTSGEVTENCPKSNVGEGGRGLRGEEVAQAGQLLSLSHLERGEGRGGGANMSL
jgi:hypothetical protein